MAIMPPGNLIGGNLVTPDQPSVLTAAEIAPNLIPSAPVVIAASLRDLRFVSQEANRTVQVNSYHAGYGKGGGEFYYDASVQRNQHNGGTIVSPTVPWDGSLSGLRNFLDGVGETASSTFGCFVRREKPHYLITEFGAVPDWNGTTGTDNRWAIEKCIKSVASTIIPNGDFATGVAGSVFIQGYSNKQIWGIGTLHKTGQAGLFSFNACDQILVYGVKGDGNLAWDEATYGSILNSTRSPSNYAFFANFANCSNVLVTECVAENFAWDGIVATGTVAVGGATATLSNNIRFDKNRIRNVRGSMLWMKAIKTFSMSGNRMKNDDGFIQKANAIFAVEWMSEGEINENWATYIGDNAIGIGELLNHVAPAVNRNIKICRNEIDTTRYHSILIAQGDRIDVLHNTIYNAGVKDNMPGVSNAVLCGAITVKGGDASGGVANPNTNVRVHGNTIVNPCELGIYTYDDSTATSAYQSDNIEITGNNISGHGTPSLATRIDSGGIRSQFVKQHKIRDNIINDGVGDGIRSFGDAAITWNTVRRITGKGIHIPSDTILSNTRLTQNPAFNDVANCTSTGIAVWGKDIVIPTGNKVKLCGTVSTGETSTDAYNMSGIAVWGCPRAEFVDNECDQNGGAGIFANIAQRVDIRGGYLNDNGQVMATDNFRSAAYVSGLDAGNPVDVTAMLTQARAGTRQRYSFRVLFGNAAQTVAVDCKVDSHPLSALGLTVKSLINIP